MKINIDSEKNSVRRGDLRHGDIFVHTSYNGSEKWMVLELPMDNGRYYHMSLSNGVIKYCDAISPCHKIGEAELTVKIK